jgi:hypothetical protein
MRILNFTIIYLTKTLGVIYLVVSSSVFAADYQSSGSIGASFRWFPQSPQYEGQFDHFQPSIEIAPEFRWYFENDSQVRVNPYLLIDGQDDERTHFDLREAYWRKSGEEWDVLIGLNKVYWGVTESRHLVDMINQVDGVVDIDEEDRLGQAMINLSTQRDWGNISLFLLPGFRERTFVDSDARPRTGLPIDSDKPLYESGAKDGHIDYAIRYIHVIDDWDIGAHVFYGTGREPHFSPSPDGMRLVPFYSIISQAGIDLQYTRDAWLWKLESIVREGQGDVFTALVGGFEYSFYQINQSAMDLGVLVEYLYDGRDEDITIAPPTAFEDDIFMGFRLALNDIQNTSLLSGVIMDRKDQSSILMVEAERRIFKNWKVEFEGRFFINSDKNPVLQNFKDDSFINISLSRYF